MLNQLLTFKNTLRYCSVVVAFTMPLAISVMLSGCKSKKLQTTDSTQKTKTEKNASLDIDTLKTIKVSFYSPGNGINHQAKRMLFNFVENFQKIEQTALVYTTEPWGKEGEVDYCFTLKNLNKRQKEKLYTGIYSLMTQQGRVHIYYNKECKQ